MKPQYVAMRRENKPEWADAPWGVFKDIGHEGRGILVAKAATEAEAIREADRLNLKATGIGDIP